MRCASRGGRQISCRAFGVPTLQSSSWISSQVTSGSGIPPGDRSVQLRPPRSPAVMRAFEHELVEAVGSLRALLRFLGADFGAAFFLVAFFGADLLAFFRFLRGLVLNGSSMASPRSGPRLRRTRRRAVSMDP